MHLHQRTLSSLSNWRSSVYVAFLMLLLLSACTPTQPAPAVHAVSQAITTTASTNLTLPATPTITLTPSSTPSLTRPQTSTPGPTSTTRPTATDTLTPTITPTFDVASIVTRTPAPPARCPVENPELVFDVNIPKDEIYWLAEPFLEFLNSGGTRKAVITAYASIYPRDLAAIQEWDVTGDGIPELLFEENFAHLYVYRCVDGQYVLHSAIDGTYHDNRPDIIALKDLNLNGVDEIVSLAGDDRYRGIEVLEWDGKGFQELNDSPELFEDYCTGMLGPSNVEIADIDGNGTQELILKQEIPIWSEYISGVPWRKETRTCTWNGKFFALIRTEYAEPEYRFQAVQDADRASLAGEYDRAIDLYQAAIFNDQLGWWSPERKAYETNRAHPGGTPQPLPAPDPREYPYLAAYSRFRLLLIHTLRGHTPEAQVVYDTLQSKFPAGQPGNEFAVMARLFLDEFGASADIGRACAKAVDYASVHPNILSYLGDSDHGWQSPTYTPGDVCPFTASP